METFKLIILSPPIASVLILPMRNGNGEGNIRVQISNPGVLILPMRNGNYTITPRLPCLIYGSYPTYEEWKLITS